MAADQTPNYDVLGSLFDATFAYGQQKAKSGKPAEPLPDITGSDLLIGLSELGADVASTMPVDATLAQIGGILAGFTTVRIAGKAGSLTEDKQYTTYKYQIDPTTGQPKLVPAGKQTFYGYAPQVAVGGPTSINAFMQNPKGFIDAGFDWYRGQRKLYNKWRVIAGLGAGRQAASLFYYARQQGFGRAEAAAVAMERFSGAGKGVEKYAEDFKAKAKEFEDKANERQQEINNKLARGKRVGQGERDLVLVDAAESAKYKKWSVLLQGPASGQIRNDLVDNRLTRFTDSLAYTFLQSKSDWHALTVPMYLLTGVLPDRHGSSTLAMAESSDKELPLEYFDQWGLYQRDAAGNLVLGPDGKPVLKRGMAANIKTTILDKNRTAGAQRLYLLHVFHPIRALTGVINGRWWLQLQSLENMKSVLGKGTPAWAMALSKIGKGALNIPGLKQYYQMINKANSLLINPQVTFQKLFTGLGNKLIGIRKRIEDLFKKLLTKLLRSLGKLLAKLGIRSLGAALSAGATEIVYAAYSVVNFITFGLLDKIVDRTLKLLVEGTVFLAMVVAMGCIFLCMGAESIFGPTAQAIPSTHFVPGVGGIKGEGGMGDIGQLPASGSCPFSGLLCTQGPRGKFSHADNPGAIDMNGPRAGQGYVLKAPEKGTIRKSGEDIICKSNGQSVGGMFWFYGESGNKYKFIHTKAIKTGTFNPGDDIGTITTSVTVGKCWTGAHAHIEVFNSAGDRVNAEQYFNNSVFECNFSCP